MAKNTPKDSVIKESVIDESGNDQLSVVPVDTDFDHIMSATTDSTFSWMRNTVDSDALKEDIHNVSSVRFSDLFGNDAEVQAGQAALDDLLGNPENHEWMQHDGVFVASDDKGTEITLNLYNAPALLMMSYTHDGKVCDHYVALQKTSVIEHLGDNTDGEAVAHMLQEIIKVGGMG